MPDIDEEEIINKRVLREYADSLHHINPKMQEAVRWALEELGPPECDLCKTTKDVITQILCDNCAQDCAR